MGFLLDTFTDANGTAITAHSPETGGSWSYASFSTNNAEIQSNRLQLTSGGTGISNPYNSQLAGTTDYELTSYFYRSGATGSAYAGVRFDPATSSGYIFGPYGSLASTMDLYKVTGGTPSLLASRSYSDPSPGAGETWMLKLRAVKAGSSAIIQGSVQRPNGDWLNSSGVFQSTQTYAIQYTDASPLDPSGGGRIWTWINSDGGVDSMSAAAVAAVAADLTVTPLTAVASSTGVAVSISASGGTAPYSVTFSRSTSADSGFTSIYSGSSTSYTDTGLGSGLYYYKATVSDSASVSVSTLAVGAVKASASVSLVCIGDSNTYGVLTTTPGGSTAPPQKMVEALGALGGPRTLTVSNQGHSGSASSDWVSGSSYLNAAKSAMTAADVQVFSIALGTNDIHFGTSKATYKANIQSAVSDLRTAFPDAFIVLHECLYLSPDANNGTYDYPAANIGLFEQYAAARSEIATADSSGKTKLGDTSARQVFADHQGDWYAAEFFSSGTYSGQRFYLHANDAGAKAWGEMLALGIAQATGIIATGGGGSGGVFRTPGGYGFGF